MAEIDPELLKKLIGEADPADLARLRDPARHSDLAIATAIDKARPQGVLPNVQDVTPPQIGSPSMEAPGTLPNIGQPKTLPNLGFKERQALPNISPGVAPGSSAFYQGKLEKLEDQQSHPWGSDENHPGFLGKLAHIGAKVGNIAGDIFAPATMSLIPGTDLNRERQINQIEPRLARAQAAEEGTAERQAAGKLAERKESSEEEERTAKTENLNEKDSTTLAEHGLMRDAEGNVKPDPTSPVYQKNQLAMDTVANVQKYRQAQQDLIAAKTEVEKAKNDPNSPAFKAAQQRLAMAQEAHRVAGQNLALHQQEFADKTQEREFVKPSGQAQSRGSAAQAVLQLMPDLDKLVKSNAAEMGPIMGRLNRGEIAIGDVDPKVAELYSAMKSFYALQPAVHGFRNAEFVKDFEHALGTLERDPDAFLAGMHGLEPTMKAVANEGVTFHKRIKEGGEGAGGGGT